MNDILFKSIEVKTRQVLPQHLAGSTHATPSKKEELVKLIARDEIIQGNWREVGEDIVDEDDFNFLLLKIINLWVTMRGFSIASKWMEDYKQAKNKTIKKTKCLRKELKSSSDSDKTTL